MRFDYDKETDSLYIHLSDQTSTETREIGPNVMADYDERGQVIGLDIQYASRFMDLSTLNLGTLPVRSLVLAGS